MNKIEVFTLRKKGITDFAKERNLLLGKAKSDWVFFVDSDERISSRQFPVSSEFSGYRVKRKNYFLGQYIGTDKIIRLGKKDTGKWKRRVHEVWNIKGQVGDLKTPILIHNTADNLSDYIKKINFYSTLHAEANREEGKKSSILKIIIYPKLKFLQTYLTSRHFVFSLMQSFHSFLAWSKLWILQRETK